MDLFYKLTAVAVICSFLCVVLQKKASDHALILGILGCCIILVPLSGMVGSVVETMRSIRELAGIDPLVFAPLLKMTAIGILTQLAEAFCREGGQQTLAQSVALCGSLTAVYVCLPLVQTVLDFLKELMLR